jgi:hypothetical protein
VCTSLCFMWAPSHLGNVSDFQQRQYTHLSPALSESCAREEACGNQLSRWGEGGHGCAIYI